MVIYLVYWQGPFMEKPTLSDIFATKEKAEEYINTQAKWAKCYYSIEERELKGYK